jgi:segregation and condensation protein B
MPPNVGSVAQGLRSVCLRYRHPLAAQANQLPPSRPWTGRSVRPRRQLPGGAGGSFCRDGRTARVEAVLFLAREPLSSRKIGQLASLADGTEARTLIRRLNHWYDAQGSAFRVEEVAGGFQLLTRPGFGGWLRRLHQSPWEGRLSGPALETLAVVAYRQPVLRADIESIRGVQCGEMLRQLMERDLIRIGGRSEELGRPFLYGTTKRFLQVFGLRHLDELPRAQVLRKGQAVSMSKASEHNPAPARDNELTPSDSNEEPEVKTVVNPEASAEELLALRAAAVVSQARSQADEEEYEYDEVDDEDEEDDEDDVDDDDEEDDLEDDDLEDEEWEEVDDDDEDEDWDDEEEDEDDDEDDWDDEEEEDEEEWDEE